MTCTDNIFNAFFDRALRVKQLITFVPQQYKGSQSVDPGQRSVDFLYIGMMRGSKSFVREGPNFDFFLFDEGRKDPNYHYKGAINYPPGKFHLNGVSLAGR